MDRHGSTALCFKTRCDVRVATSHRHKQWSSANASQSLAPTQLASSASQVLQAETKATAQECQFEVTHAKPALIADFDEDRRPCVPKIFATGGGMLLRHCFEFYCPKNTLTRNLGTSIYSMFETFVGCGRKPSCHLLPGSPQWRQRRAGGRLGQGLGIHGTWSGL